MSEDNVVEFTPREGAKPESVKKIPAGVQVVEKLLHDHAALEAYVMSLAATVISLVEHLQEQGIITVVDSETGEPDPGNLEQMVEQAEALTDAPAAE